METADSKQKKVDEKVLCLQCGKEPGFVKKCNDGDEVYHALECDCKTTPYMRSRLFVVGTWESKTYCQPPKEAFDDAIKETPSFIKIYRPSHAQLRK